jgi:hypothetical protein
MKERPILFSGPMVRAILAGTKTQTRRVVKSPARNMQAAGETVIAYRPPGDPWYKDYVWSMRDRGGTWGDYTHERFMHFCPYGQPGDRLWVRETWAYDLNVDREETPEMLAWVRSKGTARINYREDPNTAQTGCGGAAGRWRPSIHMPRWASRITLEVVSVRVERLQDITGEDVVAEGLTVPRCGCEVCARGGAMCPADATGAGLMFAELWDSINGDGAWALNPWVWVVEFRRIP